MSTKIISLKFRNLKRSCLTKTELSRVFKINELLGISNFHTNLTKSQEIGGECWYLPTLYHSHQQKYKIIKIYTVTERFRLLCIGYNYNEYIIASSGLLKLYDNKFGIISMWSRTSYPRHILGHGNKPFISGFR